MAISDEILMAYVDGELDAAACAEVDAALAGDAALRAKLEAQQKLRARLSAAFDGALAERVPARLSVAAEAPRAEVVDFAARRARRWSARDWGAMAASLAAGVVLGVALIGAPAPMIASSEHGLVARGALARALDAQLASDEAGAVRIGLSFRDHSGAYCRTFDLIEAQTSGLACRAQAGWAVAMTTANPQSEIRTAGAGEVLAAVEARIAGEPLDAKAEAAAREADWR